MTTVLEEELLEMGCKMEVRQESQVWKLSWKVQLDSTQQQQTEAEITPLVICQTEDTTFDLLQ